MSKYGWVIDRDHIGNEVAGTLGPANISPARMAELEAGAGDKWQLYDADKILYATGRIVGNYTGFEPLDDFGEGAWGCAGIKYGGEFI